MSTQLSSIEDMSTNEKLFLAQVLLRDIRLDCSCDTKRRATLARDILLAIKDECPGVKIGKLISTINEFLSYPEGVIDGRYFRDDFPYGYYHVEKFHNIKSSRLRGRSKTFKQYVRDYIHYPDMLFDDAKPVRDGGYKEWYFVDSSTWHDFEDDKPPFNIPVLCLVIHKDKLWHDGRPEYQLRVLTKLKQKIDDTVIYQGSDYGFIGSSKKYRIVMWTWTSLPQGFQIDEIVKGEPEW